MILTVLLKKKTPNIAEILSTVTKFCIFCDGLHRDCMNTTWRKKKTSHTGWTVGLGYVPWNSQDFIWI